MYSATRVMSAADIFSIVDISGQHTQTVGIRMEGCIVYSYKRAWLLLLP